MTLATCKHILVYDSQHPTTANVNVSQHDLHDYFLKPVRTHLYLQYGPLAWYGLANPQ